jgi:hypothetical protein
MFQLARNPLHPTDLFVDEFTNNIERYREPEAKDEKDDALWQGQDLEYWIHPNVCLVLDDVNPSKICGHKQRQSCQSNLTRWITSERCEKLHDDEDHNIGVEYVV